MQTLFMNISFGAYFLAMVVYVSSLFFKSKLVPFTARVFSLAGIVSLTLYIGLRWEIAGRPPLSNMFESLVLFAWAIAIAVLVTDIKYNARSIAPFGALIALLTLGYASLLNSDIVPLMPALKSNWLTIHVLTCFLGYAALTVAFVSSIGLVLTESFSKINVDAAKLDKVSYNMISFGFLFLTLGIITGAVWANSAWGTYWSWDPKETWSLITWFVYAIYLHARFQRGWRGQKAAWLSIVGFLAMLFTYFGVNYVLSGLHSYA